MRVWIDATQPESELRVFNMTLLERQLRGIAMAEDQLRGLEQAERKLGNMVHAERQLRSIAETAMRPTEILIELPAGAPIPSSLPKDLVERLPVRWSSEPGSARERLQRVLRDADGESVVAFPGNAIVDVRVLEHLAWWQGGSVAFIAGSGDDACAAMSLDAPLPDGDDEAELLDIARAEVERGHVKQLAAEELEGYIKKLRRSLPPFLFKIHDESSRQRVERFLFHSNYKGSTDFLTKFVYPPIVWRALGPLTRHRVGPNWVTGVSIVSCFAAVPCFAAGLWAPGLALAFLMSVLDSVDGKLARLTYSSSEQGDVLDHGLDIIHPPFWYWAWAWGLSGGDPFSPVFVASLWMAGFYILDRVMEMLFKGCTGHSIHGYRELDVKMRTFISRRNVNLAIFAVALPFGLGIEAFYGIVGWQAFTLLFHLSRVVRFWNEREAPIQAAARTR